MKTRMINTRFWDDTYISELEPIEKLLFLYLLTNPATNICGIYELPLRNIAFDCGLDKKQVQTILDRFTKDGKIYHFKNWVIIKNFPKHQNSRSPQVQKGIKAELDRIPAEIKDFSDKKGYGIQAILHLNLDSDSNIDSDVKKNPHQVKKYLLEIPKEDLIEFSKKYRISEQGVKQKAEELSNYCDAKGKTYKNYKAFLKNALFKDCDAIRVKHPPPKPVYIPPPDLTEAERKESSEVLIEMRKNLINKMVLKK